MILNETVAETADAIREKTGKSELIKPVDFAEEIKGITAGGEESGGSNVEYLDLREVSLLRQVFFSGAYVAKGVVADNIWICSPYMFLYQGVEDNINYLAVDMNQYMKLGAGMGTLKEALIGSGYTQEQLDSIPRITESEFYDLNA